MALSIASFTRPHRQYHNTEDKGRECPRHEQYSRMSHESHEVCESESNVRVRGPALRGSHLYVSAWAHHLLASEMNEP